MVEALDGAANRLQSACAHVRVFLRGLQTLLPQQLLDVSQIGAAFQEVRVVGVTRPMQSCRALHQRKD